MATTWGVDTAESLEGAADALAATGATFAIRYWSRFTQKNASPAEVQALWAAGISVGIVVEDYAARPTGAGAGARGSADAAFLSAGLEWLGFPHDWPGYFAADFDPTRDLIPSTLEYFAGAADTIGAARRRPYGGALILEGVGGPGWQAAATSWSQYRLSDAATVLQTVAPFSVGGIVCDINRQIRPDIACYHPTFAPTPPGAPPMPDSAVPAFNADGRLELFRIHNGRLEHNWQIDLTADTMSGWAPIIPDAAISPDGPKGPFVFLPAPPRVGLRPDGRLSAIAVNGYNGDTMVTQVAPNSGWGAPVNLT